MNFAQVIATERLILTEGSVVERIHREPGIEIDPLVANAALLYDERGRAVMQAMYRQYLDVGRDFELPMIILTPTWRANPDRLRAASLPDCNVVNRDAARFMVDLRDACGSYADRIFLGGLMGCAGDAYDPAEALPTDRAADFHRSQADALAAAGVDFLIVSTVPALCEARGLAAAMAVTGLPYIISFVVRSNGCLLDGTSLADAVADIDAAVTPPPTAFMCNCLHPTNFAAALNAAGQPPASLLRRLVGLQANASTLSLEQLDGADSLDADAPGPFADAMLDLHRRFGLRILGGCCGTDHHHIRAVAERVSRARP